MKCESIQGIDGRGPFCDRISLMAECERDRGQLARLVAALEAGELVVVTTERFGPMALRTGAGDATGERAGEARPRRIGYMGDSDLGPGCDPSTV